MNSPAAVAVYCGCFCCCHDVAHVPPVDVIVAAALLLAVAAAIAYAVAACPTLLTLLLHY